MIFDNDTATAESAALGALGTGCQVLSSESSGGRRSARRCVPLSFLVTFDERVTDERSRAHLAAFNTLEHTEIALHGRTIPLATRERGLWMEIFTPGTEILSCLGNAHPALPTVIFLTPNTRTSYEWPIIGAAIANDLVIREHYNFCTLNLPPTDSETAEGCIDAIAETLLTLLPSLKSPAQVILITQGSPGDVIVKNVKTGLKSIVPGAIAPLAIAGTLSFPSPPSSAPDTLPLPMSSTSELSRSGAVALKDTKRLLSRLASDEDGMFGGRTRGSLAPSADERLSPVM